MWTPHIGSTCPYDGSNYSKTVFSRWKELRRRTQYYWKCHLSHCSMVAGGRTAWFGRSFKPSLDFIQLLRKPSRKNCRARRDRLSRVQNPRN